VFGIGISVATVEAVAGIGTLVVAVFVFLEARRIRKVEGIFRQNEAWNDFGNAVAELHEGTRIGQILLGDGAPVVADARDLSPREAFLLMSLFNVVSSEYNAVRTKAIDEHYVIHSLTMTSRIVKTNRRWIFTFLRDNGYEESFRRVVAIVALTDDEIPQRRRAIRRELFSQTRWGKVCNGMFRAWLGERLEEHEVRALCEGRPSELQTPPRPAPGRAAAHAAGG